MAVSNPFLLPYSTHLGMSNAEPKTHTHKNSAMPAGFVFGIV